jgi:hypothetical protein
MVNRSVDQYRGQVFRLSMVKAPEAVYARVNPWAAFRARPVIVPVVAMLQDSMILLVDVHTG